MATSSRVCRTSDVATNVGWPPLPCVVRCRSHFRSHFRALLSTQGFLFFFSSAFTLLFAIFFNAVKCDVEQLNKHGFTDPDLHKSMPSLMWFGVLHNGLGVGMTCAHVLLAGACLLVPQPICLTRRQYLGLLFYTTITTSIEATVVMSEVGRRANLASNVFVLLGTCLGIDFFLIMNYRRYMREHPEITLRSTAIVLGIAKVGLDVMVGLVGSSMMVKYGFPTFQVKIRELLPQDEAFSTQILQSGAEMLFIMIFSAVWRPIWLRRLGKTSAKAIALCNENMPKDEEALDRIRLLVNFMGDMFFLIFGRGLLLDLSGTTGFILVFLVALKENTINIWNLGFKYTDECIIFSLKLCHPVECNRVDRKWKRITDTIDSYLRLHSIPKRFAVIWNYQIDYRKVDPTKCFNLEDSTEFDEPETYIRISLRVIDFRMIISNVPENFDIPPAADASKQSPLELDANRCDSSEVLDQPSRVCSSRDAADAPKQSPLELDAKRCDSSDDVEQPSRACLSRGAADASKQSPLEIDANRCDSSEVIVQPSRVCSSRDAADASKQSPLENDAKRCDSSEVLDQPSRACLSREAADASKKSPLEIDANRCDSSEILEQPSRACLSREAADASEQSPLENDAKRCDSSDDMEQPSRACLSREAADASKQSPLEIDANRCDSSEVLEQPSRACSSNLEEDISVMEPTQLPATISHYPKVSRSGERYLPAAKCREVVSRSSVAKWRREVATTDYPVFPYLPVSSAEKVKFRALCASVQAIIFQRYQILALAKIFTTFLFLAVPLATAFTETRHLPGFRSPFDDTEYGRKYLACGVFFMATDVVEWAIIMFGFFNRCEGLSEQVDRYRIVMARKKWMMRVFCGTGIYFGVYWFRMAWDPFDKKVFATKFPHIDFDEVMKACKPSFLK